MAARCLAVFVAAYAVTAGSSRLTGGGEPLSPGEGSRSAAREVARAEGEAEAGAVQAAAVVQARAAALSMGQRNACLRVFQDLRLSGLEAEGAAVEAAAEEGGCPLYSAAGPSLGRAARVSDGRAVEAAAREARAPEAGGEAAEATLGREEQRRAAAAAAVAAISGQEETPDEAEAPPGEVEEIPAGLRAAAGDDGIAPLSGRVWMRPGQRWAAALAKSSPLRDSDRLRGFGPAKPTGVAGLCSNVWVTIDPQDQRVLPAWTGHLPELIEAVASRLGGGETESPAMRGAEQSRALKTHWAYLCGRVYQQGGVLGAPDPGAPFRVPTSPADVAAVRLGLRILASTCDAPADEGSLMYGWAWRRVCDERRWG